MKTILIKAKRALSLLMVLLMIVPMTVSLVVPVSADDIVEYAVEGGNIYFDKSTGMVTGCDDSVTSANIPAVIDDVNVTQIGSQAFYNCTLLTSVILPDGMTRIADRAFLGCKALVSITIPKSVTFIGESVVAENDLLCDIYYSGTKDDWKNINIYWINGVLLNATIHCSGGDMKGCEHMWEEWQIYDSPTCTEEGSEVRLCSSCWYQESRTLPKLDHHFYSITTKHPSCTETGEEEYTCSECGYSYIETIPVKHSWNSWQKPNDVDCTVGYEMYRTCWKCGEVDSETTYVKNDSHMWNEGYISSSDCTQGFSLTKFCTVCNAKNVEKLPAQDHDWSEWGVSVEPSTLFHGTEVRRCSGCYMNQERDTEIIDCDTTVKYPVENGYIYFDKLTGCITDADLTITSADIPEEIDGVKVVGIGYNCGYEYGLNVGFTDCALLESVEIPDTVTIIYEEAFSNCDALKEIVIPDSVTKIGRDSFGGCDNLKKVVLSDNITTIPDGAFYGCTSLKDITLPANLTGIDYGAFAGCGSLEYIVFPESLSYIMNFGFSSCFSLKEVVIPENASVGEGTFENCHSLEMIVLNGNSFPSNAWYAFAGATSLKSVYISKANTFIPMCAFLNCNSLTDIYYEGSEEEWAGITVDSGNDPLNNATVHFNSTMPTVCDHVWGEWTVRWEPNCSDDGQNIRYCTNCDASETETIPALDHDWTDWFVFVVPTTTQEGVEMRGCCRCMVSDRRVLPTITNPFGDVKEGQWYTEGIIWCYSSGYMAGVSDTEFGRKDNVTRAMFATILAKIDGSDISGYSKMSFSDVKPNQWYSNAIEWAASNGYAAGLGGGIFGYKQNVSREQIALFFYTYSEKNGIDVSAKANLSAFTDLGRVHSWALDAVQWAVAKGLISGKSETTLAPRDPAARGEIALVIKNYVENVKG